MDYLRGNICWEEQGAFVYEVSIDSVTVRTHPDDNEHNITDICFKKGDMVAVDLVRPSRGASDGAFLRLSDGCGWLLEKHDTKTALTRRSVETGLWTFFVDNFPLGQALTRHPVVNRIDLVVSPQAMYPPMRRIYCDRRVTSSEKVEFFRVQGTKGWIVGRGMRNTKNKPTSMLLPEDNVKTGLFGYQCLVPTRIYIRPARKESFRTSLTVEANQLVVANLVREAGDGSTFARLGDGSGWIPLKTKGGKICLERIPVVAGSWKLCCVSVSPVRLLRQPMDRPDMICESKTTYKVDSEIECDQRIARADGVVFYRVQGTEGFVPDKRGNEILFQLPESEDNETREEGGWTPDFVRGIASLVAGVYESDHNEHTKVLTFSTAAEDQPEIQVYYSTRTVATYPSGGPCRRNCVPSDVAEVLRDPSIMNNEKHGEETPSAKVLDCHNSEVEVGDKEEAILRHQLVDCYVQSEQLKRQQLMILRVLKQCDDARGVKERALAKRGELRTRELQQLEMKRRLTCDRCGAVFKDMRAKRRHLTCLQVHSCQTCGAKFASLLDLLDHHEKSGHCGGNGALISSRHTTITDHDHNSSSFSTASSRSAQSAPVPHYDTDYSV